MKNIIIQYYKSPVGELILGSFENKLCICDWRYRNMRDTIDRRIQSFLNTKYEVGNSPIINLTIETLGEYFKAEKDAFELDLMLIGTEFQKLVWSELRKIPYGKTTTYQKLARDLGKQCAVRAVAGAVGANALSIIVPCHRVIGNDGKLTGYAGGLVAKQKLLNIENNNCRLRQLKLF